MFFEESYHSTHIARNYEYDQDEEPSYLSYLLYNLLNHHLTIPVYCHHFHYSFDTNSFALNMQDVLLPVVSANGNL